MDIKNEIRKIYPSNPYSFDLNKMLGLSFLAQRKYNPALKCFERCYEKNKKDYEITLNLSYLFTKIQIVNVENYYICSIFHSNIILQSFFKNHK